jgi:hypothetical protein
LSLKLVRFSFCSHEILFICSMKIKWIGCIISQVVL